MVGCKLLGKFFVWRDGAIACLMLFREGGPGELELRMRNWDDMGGEGA